MDTQNNLKIWDLFELTLVHESVVPCRSKTMAPVSCLYIPPEITTQELNHDHAFFGLKNGDVHIFDVRTMQWSEYLIGLESCFPEGDKTAARVTDIKCHPDKMHRLLISYEKVGVAVFSINKNRALFTREWHKDKDL